MWGATAAPTWMWRSPSSSSGSSMLESSARYTLRPPTERGLRAARSERETRSERATRDLRPIVEHLAELLARGENDRHLRRDLDGLTVLRVAHGAGVAAAFREGTEARILELG